MAFNCTKTSWFSGCKRLLAAPRSCNSCEPS